MKKVKDIQWFKEDIEPLIEQYEVSYRYFPNGDFGSLSQIIIESPNKGGGIDFWEQGWLGIDFFDYEKDELILNLLIEPNQIEEKEMAFQQLLLILKISL